MVLFHTVLLRCPRTSQPLDHSLAREPHFTTRHTRQFNPAKHTATPPDRSRRLILPMTTQLKGACEDDDGKASTSASVWYGSNTFLNCSSSDSFCVSGRANIGEVGRYLRQSFRGKDVLRPLCPAANYWDRGRSTRLLDEHCPRIRAQTHSTHAY